MRRELGLVRTIIVQMVSTILGPRPLGVLGVLAVVLGARAWVPSYRVYEGGTHL